MIKTFLVLPSLLLASCAQVETEGQKSSAVDSLRTSRVANKHPGNTRFRPVRQLSRRVNGDREILKASVDGRKLVAVLSWRPYHADLDGQVPKWFGDMNRRPPRFVVDSLTLTVDGKAFRIPWSRTRVLCSQWSPKKACLLLYTSGKNVGLTVDVGDGSEAWTSSYLIDPATLRLLSHEVEDCAAFHNYSVE